MRKHYGNSLDPEAIEQALGSLSLMRAVDPGQFVLRAFQSELCSLDPNEFTTEDVTEALRKIGHSERAEGEPTWPIFGTVLRCVNEQRAQRVSATNDGCKDEQVTAAVKRTLAQYEKKPTARYEPMTIAQEDAETQAKYAKLQKILELHR